MYAAFYPWVGAEAFLFLTRRGVIALQMAYMATAYGWALYATDTANWLQHWTVALGATLALGLLVGYLRLRLVALLDRLTAVARTDELTGILNRRAFQERFDPGAGPRRPRRAAAERAGRRPRRLQAGERQRRARGRATTPCAAWPPSWSSASG